MASNKILVFGVGGYLGGRISKHFDCPVSEVDITDLQAVQAELEKLQPDVIINTAALTLTGELEKPENQADAYKVNVQGAVNLAYASRGRYMVHISTGMMFDGQDSKETDIPAPTNYYTWTKAWADAQMVPLMDHVLITRIHTPFSKFAHPRNFLTKLQGFEKAVNEPASLTVVEDYLDALEQLIQKRATGIYNVVNPGSISFYEITKMMGLSVGELTKEEVRAMGGAYQTYPTLSTDKLASLGVHMRPVREAIESIIKEYEV